MNKQLILGIAIGAAAVALIAGAPVTSLLYGLLFLACPLMMIFMMGGHGHGDPAKSSQVPTDRDTAKKS